MLTIQELPSFLSRYMKDLENTTHYKKNGYVRFYLHSQRLGSLYNYTRFNPSGKTLKSMFIPLKDSTGRTLPQNGKSIEIEQKFRNLPFKERARLSGFGKYLSVAVFRDEYFKTRIEIFGFSEPRKASIIVVKEIQNGNQVATPPKGYTDHAPQRALRDNGGASIREKRERALATLRRIMEHAGQQQ